MVWFVQPLKKVNEEVWHLVASSDEGGGFHPCCSHPHATAEEAQDCGEAKTKAGSFAGFELE